MSQLCYFDYNCIAPSSTVGVPLPFELVHIYLLLLSLSVVVKVSVLLTIPALAIYARSPAAFKALEY